MKEDDQDSLMAPQPAAGEKKNTKDKDKGFLEQFMTFVKLALVTVQEGRRLSSAAMTVFKFKTVLAEISKEGFNCAVKCREEGSGH